MAKKSLLTHDDRRILRELDTNCLRSFQEIASGLRMNKNTIAYRVTRMQQLGVIKGFQTVIDCGHLGLTGFRIFLKLQGANTADEQRLLRFLTDNSRVMWVVSIQGEFDVGAVLLVKDVWELDDFWRSLLTKFHGLLAKRQVTVMSGVHYHPRPFVQGKGKSARPVTFLSLPRKKGSIDELDVRLLGQIAANCRISMTEVAGTLGVSMPTIYRRLSRLEKLKVIVGYKAVFGYEVLGWLYIKVHLLLRTCAPHSFKEMQAFIADSTFVVYQNDVVGGDDFEFELQIETEGDLETFCNELRNRFGNFVQEIKIMRYVREHKYNHVPKELTG